MAIHQGKVGTRRVIGIQRAQLVKIERLCASIVRYNAELALRVPPIVFVDSSDVTALLAMQVLCQKYLDQVNV